MKAKKISRTRMLINQKVGTLHFEHFTYRYSMISHLVTKRKLKFAQVAKPIFENSTKKKVPWVELAQFSALFMQSGLIYRMQIQAFALPSARRQKCSIMRLQPTAWRDAWCGIIAMLSKSECGNASPHVCQMGSKKLVCLTVLRNDFLLHFEASSVTWLAM